MTTETRELTPTTENDNGAALIEQVVIGGDLARLTPEQRVQHYRAVCESLGLNPLTQPFAYLTLNNKLTLYAKKDATDQIRTIRGVSVTRLERELMGDIYTVVAYGRDRNGREDSSLGAVNVKGLSGENLANAYMKAESKSKRRLTLSLSGLGWLDEIEVESVPAAQRTDVDAETGEIVQPKSLAEKVSEAKAAVVEEAPSEPLNLTAGGTPPLELHVFLQRVEAADLSSDKVAGAAKDLFGADARVGKLSDGQRGELARALGI